MLPLEKSVKVPDDTGQLSTMYQNTLGQIRNSNEIIIINRILQLRVGKYVVDEGKSSNASQVLLSPCQCSLFSVSPSQG